MTDAASEDEDWTVSVFLFLSDLAVVPMTCVHVNIASDSHKDQNFITTHFTTNVRHDKHLDCRREPAVKIPDAVFWN